MRNSIFLSLIVMLLFNCHGLQAQYPATNRIPVVDNYFGKNVTDNYRWMEDMNNPDVTSWFKTQGMYTDNILDKILGRNKLIEEWKQLDKLQAANFTNIIVEKDFYFYMKTKPDDAVGKLYYRKGKTGKEILLMDPATFITGKTMSMPYYVPSDDGSKVAIGLAEKGGEVATIYIMETQTQKLFPEKIFPSWFGVTGWLPDNQSFIYTIQQTGDKTSMDFLTDTKAMVHRLGDDPKNDKEILSRTKYPSLGMKPEDLMIAYLSDDRDYMIGLFAGVDNDAVAFIAPISTINQNVIPWLPFTKKEDHVTNMVEQGNYFYLLSRNNAPHFKILRTSKAKPDIANAEVVVAEGNKTITSISRSQNYFFYSLNDGINDEIHEMDFRTGKSEIVPVPGSGSKFISPYSVHTDECFVGSTSWNLPFTRYDYIPGVKKPEVSFLFEPVKYPGLENIVVEEVVVPSYDGTLVPLSIVHLKGIKMDGNNCCLLDGYGSYGISSTPYFDILNYSIINKGVIYAEAHVRGGGEKGDAWYKAGYKQTKPNTWKDFIACAEYLETKGYTSNQKLAGMGTSAGGILIGRAITERPDLFKAAICNVGVANALRMESTPNGPNNSKEFGTVKDSSECMGLMEMDALYHVKDGTKYPAVLCNTGMNDPRVESWVPAKFAAALQHSSASGNPVLLRVDYNNGHFTDDKNVSFKEWADLFSFHPLANRSSGISTRCFKELKPQY